MFYARTGAFHLHELAAAKLLAKSLAKAGVKVALEEVLLTLP